MVVATIHFIDMFFFGQNINRQDAYISKSFFVIVAVVVVVVVVF